jgi:hypothetical protein
VQPASGTFSQWVRRSFVGLGAVLLGWLVLTQGLAAYLATVAPATALRINPRQPTALLQLADAKLADITPADAQTGSPEDKVTARERPQADNKLAVEIRGLIERARHADPLNAQVPLQLATLAERLGDQSETVRQLVETVRRSAHEPSALYKLIVYKADNRDFAAAASYAELLLRTRPDTASAVLPILIRLAEIDEAIPALTAMLARKPSWRPWLFMEMPSKAQDYRTTQRLLLALKDAANPPTSLELQAYLGFLTHRNLYGLAYYTWLQFTPPDKFDEPNQVFNGAFKRPTTNLPFDWIVSAGSGASVQFVARPDADGRHGLNVEFGSGRIEFDGVSQVLLLAPGTYQFTAQYHGSLIGRRGLVWRLTCERSTAVMETPMLVGIQSSPLQLSQSITIPETGCTGQQLSLLHLARSSSEQLLSGWRFKDIKIIRQPDPQGGNR